LQPYGRYAVASQETEPSLGWAYASFLRGLNDNPDMNGGELGKLIVSSYIQDDQRILDDQARLDFLRQGSPLVGLFGQVNDVPPEQLAQQMERSITLTAVDLEAFPALIKNLNNLAYSLQSEDQSLVARARDYAQAFTNIFGKDTPSSYIDLGNFVQLLKQETSESKVSQAADGVISAIRQVVVAEKHGPGKRGASGISIYFPNSTLYRSPVAGPQSYNVVANRFTKISLWDDFLAFHYIDRSFEPSAAESVTPAQGARLRVPGGGQIELSQIKLSGKTAEPGKPVKLSVDVSGTNIGYIYLFVGYYDQQSNSIFVADTDFLESPDTRQVDGVYYPKWEEGGAFTMTFQWDPTVFAISDGQQTVTALLTPQQYGASAEEAVYTVDGIYTFADGGETRSARLYFHNGILWQVFGFTAQDGTGAAREIIPQAGDTFTILEKWLDLNSDGSVKEVAWQEGATLTFSDKPFTWKEQYAAPGEYLVGFQVTDLDGNSQEVYTRVTVR